VSRLEQEAATGDDHPARDKGQDTVLEAVRAVRADDRGLLRCPLSMPTPRRVRRRGTVRG
jgi:hypothetical protein